MRRKRERGGGEKGKGGGGYCNKRATSAEAKSTCAVQQAVHVISGVMSEVGLI